MILPNFLIVGAAKAGTTTLYDVLAQHPEVGMSFIKEPNYFSDGWPDWAHSLEEYSALFRGHEKKKARGEASPFYFCDPQSAPRIRETLGADIRILIMLRNPADRAYSHWVHERYKYAREPLSFEAALGQEPERAVSTDVRRLKFYYPGLYRYRWGSEYAEKVKWYLDIFGHSHLRVLILEEFVRDPVAHSQDVFRFLGVDDTFVPRIPRSNPASDSAAPAVTRLISSINQSRLFQGAFGLLPMAGRRFAFRMGDALFGGLQRRTAGAQHRLEPHLREALLKSYLPDIHALEQLLGRNLRLWYDMKPLS